MPEPKQLEAYLSRIERDGYAVIEGAVESGLLDALSDDLLRLERDLESVPTKNDFEGEHTVRIYNLLAHGRLYEAIPVNEAVLPVVEGVLDDGCLISSLSSISIDPDETAQPIHADDQLIPLPKPHPAIICNTMWALTDFTEETGGTRVILGSHLWDDERVPCDDDEIVQAVMPRGSCLIYLGSVWHGGGANHTGNQWRAGMICGYSLGWLRQEENQYLAVPPEIAKSLPEHVQHLIGYKIHGDFLGWVEGQDPHVVLEDRYSDVMPAAPEGGEATEETEFLKFVTMGKPRYYGLT